jgi:hypothetical protein
MGGKKGKAVPKPKYHSRKTWDVEVYLLALVFPELVVSRAGRFTPRDRTTLYPKDSSQERL